MQALHAKNFIFLEFYSINWDFKLGWISESIRYSIRRRMYPWEYFPKNSLHPIYMEVMSLNMNLVKFHFSSVAALRKSFIVLVCPVCLHKSLFSFFARKMSLRCPCSVLTRVFRSHLVLHAVSWKFESAVKFVIFSEKRIL